MDSRGIIRICKLACILLTGCTTIIDKDHILKGNDTIFDTTPRRISFDTIPEPEYHHPSKDERDLKREFVAPHQSLFSKLLMFDPDYIGVKYDYFIQFNIIISNYFNIFNISVVRLIRRMSFF